MSSFKKYIENIKWFLKNLFEVTSAAIEYYMIIYNKICKSLTVMQGFLNYILVYRPYICANIIGLLKTNVFYATLSSGKNKICLIGIVHISICRCLYGYLIGVYILYKAELPTITYSQSQMNPLITWSMRTHQILSSCSATNPEWPDFLCKNVDM